MRALLSFNSSGCFPPGGSAPHPVGFYFNWKDLDSPQGHFGFNWFFRSFELNQEYFYSQIIWDRGSGDSAIDVAAIDRQCFEKSLREYMENASLAQILPEATYLTEPCPTGVYRQHWDWPLLPYVQANTLQREKPFNFSVVAFAAFDANSTDRIAGLPPYSIERANPVMQVFVNFMLLGLGRSVHRCQLAPVESPLENAWLAFFILMSLGILIWHGLRKVTQRIRGLHLFAGEQGPPGQDLQILRVAL